MSRDSDIASGMLRVYAVALCPADSTRERLIYNDFNRNKDACARPRVSHMEITLRVRNARRQ